MRISEVAGTIGSGHDSGYRREENADQNCESGRDVSDNLVVSVLGRLQVGYVSSVRDELSVLWAKEIKLKVDCYKR